MFNRKTSTKIFAPRRQARKGKYFPIFSELGVLCALQLAPWNTKSIEVELFAGSAIPRGESSFSQFVIQNPAENINNFG